MNTETMTVHKALAELKVLSDRINKSINGHSFVLANKHANAKIAGIKVSEVCEAIKSDYRKANDLI